MLLLYHGIELNDLEGRKRTDYGLALRLPNRVSAQKPERLSFDYNLPEAAISTKCGFALLPKHVSEHLGKKHGIDRSPQHGLEPLLFSS